MDLENGNKNFGDLDFHFPRLWSFGEISNSARRRGFGEECGRISNVLKIC